MQQIASSFITEEFRPSVVVGWANIDRIIIFSFLGLTPEWSHWAHNSATHCNNIFKDVVGDSIRDHANDFKTDRIDGFSCYAFRVACWT
jgi:hypothetical protein